MEWVAGQYQQCAYAVGKCWEDTDSWEKKKEKPGQAGSAELCTAPPRHGGDYHLKNVDALECQIRSRLCFSLVSITFHENISGTILYVLRITG